MLETHLKTISILNQGAERHVEENINVKYSMTRSKTKINILFIKLKKSKMHQMISANRVHLSITFTFFIFKKRCLDCLEIKFLTKKII